MSTTFFPDVIFAWTFYGVLISLLGIASYTDQRWKIIPKWLTLTILPLGLLFNLARGGWLGYQGLPVWSTTETTFGSGALEGLLFGLAGFGLMFALFVFLWILGACGGGDVKLFAAIGAWLGPTLSIAVLTGSLGVLALMLVFQLFATVFRHGVVASAYSFTHASSPPAKKSGRLQQRKNLVSYSLPLMLATAVVLLWVFRVDLQLAAPRPSANERVQIHVP